MQQQQRGCLNSTHNQKEAIFLCTKPKCDNKSRLVCLQCVQKNTHDHHSHFVQLNEIFEKKEEFLKENWPQNEQIREIYHSSNSDGNTYVKQIEEFLDNLVNNFSSQIRTMKKDIKVKILESQYKMKDIVKEFQTRIENAYDLSQLEKNVELFKDSKMDISELHKRVQEFSDNKERINQEKMILKEFREKQKEINAGRVNIKALNQLDEDFFAILEGFPKRIFRPAGMSLEFEPLPNCKDFCSVSNGGTLIRGSPGGYDTARSMEFGEDDQINFSFRINKFVGSYLYFGIADKKVTDKQQYFWFGQLPQIELKGGSKNIQTFKSEGKNQLQNVFKEGQQYEVSICIAENQFDIQDINGEASLKFSGKFQKTKKNNGKYVVVIGENSTQGDYEIEFI